jgi:indolepyruvate ferredoxin oxidoreductase
MAVKDEYEVARLFTDGSFERQLRNEFAGWKRLDLHLAPPLTAARDPASGHLRKAVYGPWVMTILRPLARLRRIRGTWLDPFFWSADRRLERRLLADYEATLATIVDRLTPQNHALAVPLAHYPEKIRGYGHVKLASVNKVAPEASARREAFVAGLPRIAEAAE